jgi:hypothetical protein
MVTFTGGVTGGTIGAPHEMQRLVPGGLLAPQYLQLTELFGIEVSPS